MASSEGLSSVDSWLYRQSFNVDSWLLSDTFSHDSDLLAKALHTTVTSPSSAFTDLSSTHTISSGSNPEIFSNGSKRKHNNLLTVSDSDCKLAKRRPRASKKSHTTFITADPANFRQMVQQVTGANYIYESSPCDVFSPIKPEPHRLVNRMSFSPSDQSTAVPTLDTSAFLSNHHTSSSTLSVGGAPSGKANATVDVGVSAVEFDTYPIFPTLESYVI